MLVSFPVRRAAALILLALAAACSDQTPTAPSGPNDVSGRWFSSDRRLRLDLAQSGSTVQGTVVYLDGTAPPEMVEHGWRVTAIVGGSRMTGTISWFGIPRRYPRGIQDITFVRAGGTR